MAKRTSKPGDEPGQELVVAKDHTPAIGGAELPAYLQGFKGPTGAEDIRNENVTIPRMKIGQDMSPEVQEGGVARGDFFLNVSGEVISNQGARLPFIILARNVEIILWRPKKDGGGILARAREVETANGWRYEWDKPNQSFDVKVEGLVKVTWKIGRYADEKTLECVDGMKSVLDWGSEVPADKDSKKAATDHHNFVVALPTMGDLVCALSLSRTATSKAKDLNASIKMSAAKGVPVPAQCYTVETIEKPVPQGGSGTYFNYKFRPAGFLQDQAAYLRYQAMADSFKDQNIVVDHSDGDNDGEHDDRA